MPGARAGWISEESYAHRRLKHTHTHTQVIKHRKKPHTLYTRVRAPTNTHTSHPLLFPEPWLPPCLSFWLFFFQQSQLITPYCCRQLQTTTNLEFHYSKLFHMCFQGPGRLGWPRFRKEQPPIGTHPHPANTAVLPSFSFFPPFSRLFALFHSLLPSIPHSNYP